MKTIIFDTDLKVGLASSRIINENASNAFTCPQPVRIAKYNVLIVN